MFDIYLLKPVIERVIIGKLQLLACKTMQHLKGYADFFFSICYLSPSRVPDKKIDTILSTVVDCSCC